MFRRLSRLSSDVLRSSLNGCLRFGQARSAMADFLEDGSADWVDAVGRSKGCRFALLERLPPTCEGNIAWRNGCPDIH